MVTTREIDHATHRRVVNLGLHPQLEQLLDQWSTEAVQELYEWARRCDRQAPNEYFLLCGPDGSPYATSTQPNLGRTYLLALNRFRQICVELLNKRALDARVRG